MVPRRILWPLSIVVLVCTSAYGQLTPEEQQLLNQYSRQKSSGSSLEESIGFERYKSPVEFSDQDKSFYVPPAGSAPPSDVSKPAEPDPPKTASDLNIFGYNMFEGSPESFSQVLEATPPPDYKLGPGDNVLVNIWGRVDMQLDLTVDREGKIFIPKAGEIIAWGLTMDEFKQRVETRLSSIYSDYKFSVSLGKIRRIKIFVYGEVKRPGGYTTSSLATLFNALYLAGGPTQNGSLRTIKHIRGSKTVAQIDLYRFLLHGDNSQDSKLESGDVIFVPVVGPLVRIAGQVKRPAIYEISGGEKITDLIELAGGPTAESFLEMISIDRVTGDDSRMIQDVDLSERRHGVDSAGFDMANLYLQDGDRLAIPSVFDFRKNTVKLMGNVKHPGVFGLSDSMRVLNLIDQGEQLKRDTYLKRANLFRTWPDQTREIYPVDLDQILAGIDSTNYVLADKDSLVIYSEKEIRRQMTVAIYGAVKQPGTFEYFDRMRLSDLIFLAGNPLKQSYLLQAEIARQNPGKPASIVYANLEKVLNAKDTVEDIYLAEDDIVFVRTIPRWQLGNTVAIEGEVMFPGQYAITKEGERLSSLIQRCGGFTPDAFPEGLVFVRNSISNDIEKRDVRGILASTEATVLDSLNRPLPKLAAQIDMTGLNRIIIDPAEFLKNPDSPDDIVLQDGDGVYVPRRPPGIQVLGAVAYSGTVAFAKNQRASYYIRAAGGYSKNADAGQTRMARANGRVLAASRALRTAVEPGDVIIVPQKIKRDTQWLKSTTTVATVLGTIATVFLVADRVK